MWLEVAFGTARATLAAPEPGHTAELQQSLLPATFSLVLYQSCPLPCHVCGGSWDGQASHFRRINLQDSFQPMFCQSPSQCFTSSQFPMLVLPYKSIHILFPSQSPGLTNISHPTPCFLLFPVFFQVLIFCAASSLPLLPYRPERWAGQTPRLGGRTDQRRETAQGAESNKLHDPKKTRREFPPCTTKPHPGTSHKLNKPQWATQKANVY